jgi:hypothetical protein
MENLKKIYADAGNRMFVSFLCPMGREFETLELLEDLGIKGVSTKLVKETRVFAGSGKTNTGYEFSGITEGREFITLMETLAAKKIAGYSRETQVISRSPDEDIEKFLKGKKGGMILL